MQIFVRMLGDTYSSFRQKVRKTNLHIPKEIVPCPSGCSAYPVHGDALRKSNPAGPRTTHPAGLTDESS